MSMSQEQEKDFLEFWDYCREILDVARGAAARSKSGEPMPLFIQNMVLAYAAVTWNARRKDMRTKAKKEGGAE